MAAGDKLHSLFNEQVMLSLLLDAVLVKQSVCTGVFVVRFTLVGFSNVLSIV